ncbi:MAG: hypothetical protein FRX49_03354 [Trebouxia sp. A1-2]|nr:MAG: hypothetical protein FRX49_03354 [Trebouxia sp. A1-2]
MAAARPSISLAAAAAAATCSIGRGAATLTRAGAGTCPGGRPWPSCKAEDVAGVVVKEGWGCGLGAMLGPDKTGPPLAAGVALEGRGRVGTAGVGKVADCEAMEGSTMLHIQLDSLATKMGRCENFMTRHKE